VTQLSRRTFLAAAGLGASAAALAKWQTEPDTILHNGRIWTGAAREREVEALAIAGGRVLAVGTSAEMLALANSGTRRVDLGGRRVTPGFNDAHAHPGLGGIALLTQVQADLDSIDAITAAIRKKAAETPPGKWIEGALYDDTKTPRPLNRADLDEVAPDHPVLVHHRGGHTAFVNSRALALGGVDERTPNPPGGEYSHDAGGRLNGRVADAAAQALEALIPRPTRDDYRRAAALISAHLARSGVTSSNDADSRPDVVQGYQDARDAGELKVRIYAHIGAPHLDKFIAAGIHSGLGDEWVRIGAVKLYADGSISERTALLSEPYLGLDGYKGIAVAAREALYAQARKAHLGGWQIGTHANGDVAIDTVIGVYEQLQRDAPRRDPRFRIEHCTLVNADLIRRMKAVGAIPVPFAGYVYFHGEKLHFYGDERLRHMFAMRDFLDAGLKPPSSSDYTASPHEPMLWMRSQVTRTDATGHTWGGNQRITAEESLRCGTLHGAYASFEEGIKGTLEPGMLADLVAWSADPLTIEPMRLLEIHAERTMVGGRWVYES
jgi:predicted amidohydrolase YtcJ